jgi:ADP-heptose:LPS heptosyltransferase
MKFRAKILADRWVGAPLAFLLGFVVRGLGLLLRPDHSVPENPRTIVVAKFEGMGSILYAGILCEALKKRYPRARLVFVTRTDHVELVKRMASVDAVLSLEDRDLGRCALSLAALVVDLARLRPELYFDLEVYSSFAAIIATLSMARNRYGYYRKAATFKRGLHTRTVFFNTNRHISEIYLQFAQAVGAFEGERTLAPPNLLPEDRDECRSVLERLGVDPDARIILINPNASELMLERRWPLENWAELLEDFPAGPKDVLLLVGSSGERSYVGDLYRRLSPAARSRTIDATGRFTLGGYLALIERSALMVTCDSGPLHFAVALGRPTVSLWGPASPAHYGPYGDLHRTLYRPVYCSPCLYHADATPCGGENVCMKELPTEWARDAAREALRGEPREAFGAPIQWGERKSERE